MFVKNNTCNIFCPVAHEYSFLLYMERFFNVKKIYFKKNYFFENNFSELNIIDVKYINFFLQSIKNYNSDFNNKKYIIFFWNGDKHYTQYKEETDTLKRILKDKLFLFFAGNASEKKNILFSENIVSEITHNIICYNINFITRIKFFFPLMFSIVLYIKEFFENIIIYKKSICFTGLVKISKKNHIDVWKNNFKLRNISIKILNLLDNYTFDLKNLATAVDRAKFLFNSKKFNSLDVAEKYFIVQIYFRNIFIFLMKQNRLFFHQDWDDRRNLINTFFYKNLIHLDLGSTAGNNDSYVRNFILLKFKKKILKINIFNDIDLNNKVSFSKQVGKMFEHIEYLMAKDIKNMNLKNLIKLISIK